MEIRVKLLGGKMPTKAYEFDAGFDLYASEQAAIRPGETCKIKTGVSMAIPNGHYGQIADRSSVGSKGLKVMGGVVDSAYRGEILVCLCNTNQDDDRATYIVSPGDKVAQLIIIPIPQPKLIEVESLEETQRGNKGFGSSDIKYKADDCIEYTSPYGNTKLYGTIDAIILNKEIPVALVSNNNFKTEVPLYLITRKLLEEERIKYINRNIQLILNISSYSD